MVNFTVCIQTKNNFMRLLILILLLPILSFGQANRVGGGTTSSASVSATTYSVVATFTATPTFVIAKMAYNPNSATTDFPTITDNMGHTYTEQNKSATNGWQAEYSAYTYGSFSGISTLTVIATFTSGHNRGITFAVLGYTNINVSSNPLDKNNKYNSSTTSVSSQNPGSITPTSTPNLILFSSTFSGSAITTSVVPTGYSLVYALFPAGCYSYNIYEKSGTTSAENPTSLGTSNGAACSIADYFALTGTTRCGAPCDGWRRYH